MSRRLVLSLLVFGVSTSVVPSAYAQPLRDEKGYAIVFPRNGEVFAANVLRSNPDTLVILTNGISYVEIRLC